EEVEGARPAAPLEEGSRSGPVIGELLRLEDRWTSERAEHAVLALGRTPEPALLVVANGSRDEIAARAHVVARDRLVLADEILPAGSLPFGIALELVLPHPGRAPRRAHPDLAHRPLEGLRQDRK